MPTRSHCTRAILAALAAVALLWAGSAAADVRSSPHNLAVSGPGGLAGFGPQSVCYMCHTPHIGGADAPRWNRLDPGRIYIKYWSPTLDAYGRGAAPPVDGTSRLCLSCHDGTVALGSTAQGPGTRRLDLTELGTAGSAPTQGINLSGTHPISFRVTESIIARNNTRDLPLRSLSAMRGDPEVRLDSNDKIQCTTCHDPHDDKYGASSGVPFYRKPTWAGPCLVCHDY